MRIAQYKNIGALVVFVLMAKSLMAYPVTVESCDESVEFNQTPTRMITHDVNIAEMAFALHLQPYMAGVTGVSGSKSNKRFKEQLSTVPELASKYPSMENLLLAQTDLYFAGWGYGMRVGGPVTPDRLAYYNIRTLALTESCVRINRERYPQATLSLLYDDMARLGKVFNKEAEAEQLVESWQNRIKIAQEKTKYQKPQRVFLYDSGEDKPLTVGKFAMPNAFIEILGSKNIMDDLPTSWGRTSWEIVAIRQPELIILLDYLREGDIENKKKFLANHPVMKHTPAVRNQNYVVVSYAEATPGPSNINAIERLAQAMENK